MSRERIEIPTLEDDGLLTLPVGSWAEEKYRLVKLYASVFTTSMRGKWDELVYMDLFAGAGRSRIRPGGRIVPASPLLALGLDHRFQRYIFCERDPRRLNALRERVQSGFPTVDSRFIQGNVNQSVSEILAELPRPRPNRKVLAFCFVDPYSVKNLRFKTIEVLAERFVDFLVLIPTGYDATRNEDLYRSTEDTRVEQFLGDPNWRNDWERARASKQTFDHFMTDAFGESMRRLDYLYEGLHNSHLVRSTEKKLRLYRLVLFSRNELGSKFWREVRKSASDQRALPF